MPSKPSKGRKTSTGSRKTPKRAKAGGKANVSKLDDAIKQKGTVKGSILSARIREAADRIGGLAELARRLGVPRQSLTRWTATQKPTVPGADRLADIARHTGCDPGWLLSGEGCPERPVTPNSHIAEEVGTRLRNMIGDLVDLLGALRPALTDQQIDDLKKAMHRDW